jgi:hypothetical protein
MRRLLSIVLVAGLAGSLAVACGDTSQEPTGTLIRVPTQPPPPPGETACMAALLEGRLVADARWGIAVQAPDGQVVKVMWPNGYVGRQTGGLIELLDGRGAVYARVGDQVSMGGGLGPADWWYACG